MARILSLALLAAALTGTASAQQRGPNDPYTRPDTAVVTPRSDDLRRTWYDSYALGRNDWLNSWDVHYARGWNDPLPEWQDDWYRGRDDWRRPLPGRTPATVEYAEDRALRTPLTLPPPDDRTERRLRPLTLPR